VPSHALVLAGLTQDCGTAAVTAEAISDVLARTPRLDYERTAPMNRSDQAALAQHLHRTPDGAVGDAVVRCEIPLAAQPRTGRQFTRSDPRGDVIGNTEVREIRVPAALRLKITHSTTIAIVTCGNVPDSSRIAL
jgi:hypothetical protein